MKNIKKLKSGIFGLSLLFLLSVPFLSGCSSDKDNGTGPATPETRVIISPQPLYFGKIPAGQSASRPFLFSNIGSANLIVQGIVIEGDNASLFSLVDPPAQIELTPNTTEPADAGEFFRPDFHCQ